MRIAIIADIHGNLPALEATLADVGKVAPDQLVVAGDVVDGGPDSAACWELVKTLGCPVLRGNHERYVYDFGTSRADPGWAEPQFAPLHFARAELSSAQIAELAALPARWTTPEAPGLLVVHASPRSDSDSVFAHTPDGMVNAAFAEAREYPLIVRGHNHQCALRDWAGGRIVTSGSVGLSQEGYPGAYYVVLDREAKGTAASWRIHHRLVRYKVEETLRRFRESGYLAKTGVMGRLFYREVATGTRQIVPFLRFQSQLKDAGLSLPADELLRRFFSLA